MQNRLFRLTVPGQEGKRQRQEVKLIGIHEQSERQKTKNKT